MKISCRSVFMLVGLIAVTLLPAHQAQQVKVPPEVTGYVGRDVTLPCEFIPKDKDKAQITLIQWFLKLSEENQQSIIVYHNSSSISVPESRLKDRVEVTDRHLTIRDVRSDDAGSYKCRFTTFPSGSFDGDTELFIYEQMPLPAGVVAAIVVAVMLLFVIVAATASLIFIRRCGSGTRRPAACRPHVRVMSSFRRDEDVVYADVIRKGPGTAALCPRGEGAVLAEDVTYAQVVRRPLSEDMEVIV